MIGVDEALDKFHQYYKGRGGATINYDEAYKIAVMIVKQEQLLGNHLLGICKIYLKLSVYLCLMSIINK